jgi:hypothetical protein
MEKRGKLDKTFWQFAIPAIIIEVLGLLAVIFTYK